MPRLVVIGPQIKEKQRGAHCAPPAYMVPKDPSLNRVNTANFARSNIWLTEYFTISNERNSVCFAILRPHDFLSDEKYQSNI